MTTLVTPTAKKASDPNLASPMTPVPSGSIGLGEDSSAGLVQDSITEEFGTPKGNTPMIPERLPLTSNGPSAVGADADNQSDVLIKLTSDLNKAIRQRDINAFQYVHTMPCDKFSPLLLGNCVILKSLILIQKLVQCW